VQHFYVDVAIPDSSAADLWRARLERLLEEGAEAGAVVHVRDVSTLLTDVVTVHDVNAFMQGYDKRDAARTSRSVFYYMVEELNVDLVVRCTRCTRRFGVCRCEDRGGDLRGTGWTHGEWLAPAKRHGEDFWAIERTSLLRFDVTKLPVDRQDRTGARRVRLLAFFERLKSQSAR
jgi:hypothetical protein